MHYTLSKYWTVTFHQSQKEKLKEQRFFLFFLPYPSFSKMKLIIVAQRPRLDFLSRHPLHSTQSRRLGTNKNEISLLDKLSKFTRYDDYAKKIVDHITHEKGDEQKPCIRQILKPDLR